MLEVALLPVSPTVEPAVLALNNAHAAELSWLDNGRLTLLLRAGLPRPRGRCTWCARAGPR